MRSWSAGSKVSAVSGHISHTRSIHNISSGVNAMGHHLMLNIAKLISAINNSVKFVVMQAMTVFLILVKMILHCDMACIRLAKLSSISTISALSLATSVPVIHIATQISAFLSAGASLTPSQVTATI